MPLSRKMRFSENVYKTSPCLRENSNLYILSIEGCDFNAVILQTQHEEYLTFLFKINLEFEYVFKISICKPSVTTIKFQDFSFKPSVASFQFQAFSLKLSIPTIHSNTQVAILSCNTSVAILQSPPFAFSLKPSFAAPQFEAVFHILNV